MIDVGFINGEAETRFFKTGLAPEVANLDVKKCSWCNFFWFLVEGLANLMGHLDCLARDYLHLGFLEFSGSNKGGNPLLL